MTCATPPLPDCSTIPANGKSQIGNNLGWGRRGRGCPFKDTAGRIRTLRVADSISSGWPVVWLSARGRDSRVLTAWATPRDMSRLSAVFRELQFLHGTVPFTPAVAFRPGKLCDGCRRLRSTDL